MLTLRDVACVRGSGPESFTVRVDRLQISRGETIAITGASGCGKSTLLEILALVLRPAVRDRFTWESASPGHGEQDIAVLWQRDAFSHLTRIRARRIGFVLQTGGLLPYLDVRSNIELARRIARLPSRGSPVPRLMDTLGLSHLDRKMPHQLSVGERQRVSIARAMAHEPELLLADEPTAALDPELAEQVIELMLELVERTQTTAVIVTHDRDRVRARVDREIVAQPIAGETGRGSCFGAAC
ncbi:MAG: ABC transporter ATP-binding protein [Gammaproteobacteria bacterium]|nr:ABC transporter ATP-binding protein [Gammaproteobacteria bacterium]